MNKKIIIVGAGPIGCYTAQLLKKCGHEPLLIEEHSEVGRPIHCTGLVGRAVFEEDRPYNISEGSIMNVINGAIIHFDGQHFEIGRKKVAYVIDREKFDKELSRNLNIQFQNRFLGLEKFDSGYIVETDKNELFADILIAADGANSSVRRMLNPKDEYVQQLRGVQLRLKTKPKCPDKVEVYLKENSFYWVVPENEDIVRVGTISETPFRDLQDFVKEYKFKGEVIEKFGGLVAIGLCPTTVKDNIALVGDAACQVKPLTYGGIYFGLKTASLLCECIRNNNINDYDYLWKKELGLEIRFGLRFKSIYSRLTTKDLNKFFKLIISQKNLIERLGDFENHSSFILELMKKPAFYSYLGEIISLFFKGKKD